MSEDAEGMPGNQSVSEILEAIGKCFRGVVSAIAMPGSLLLRVQMGERTIGLMAVFGLFCLHPLLIFGSAFAGNALAVFKGVASEGTASEAAADWIILATLYSLAVARWLWEWINNREREGQRRYVLSRYHGRVWWLPEVPGWWALSVAACVPLLAALWAFAFVHAAASAMWLTLVGLGMVLEVLYLMADWRNRILDMRDAFIDQKTNEALDDQGALRSAEPNGGRTTMQQIAPLITASQMIDAARRFDNRDIV